MTEQTGKAIRRSEKPLLVIFAAHSGAGKSTIIRALLQKHPDWLFSVSATTRPPRNNEKEGVSYHFISHNEFRKLADKGKMLEYEEVHGEYYGTPKSEAERAIEKNACMILDLDVLGALNVQSKYPDHSLSFFIDVPDMSILEKRLRKRGSDSDEQIGKRLSRIPDEREKMPLFDLIVVNNELDKTIDKIDKIITERITR